MFGVELHGDAIVFHILILQIIVVHVVILCNTMNTYNYNWYRHALQSILAEDEVHLKFGLSRYITRQNFVWQRCHLNKSSKNHNLQLDILLGRWRKCSNLYVLCQMLVLATRKFCISSALFFIKNCTSKELRLCNN